MTTDTPSAVDELRKAIQKQEALRAKTRARIAMVIALISSMGAAIVASQLFDIIKPTFSPRLVAKQNQNEVVELKKELKSLQLQISKVQGSSLLATKQISGAALTNAQATLAADLKRVDARLTSLEGAILENPERALSIPLIRKDIDESGKRMDEYKVSIRTEIDRLYDQQKWMLGGIGTVLLAVAGGAITILLRSLSKGKGVEEP